MGPFGFLCITFSSTGFATFFLGGICSPESPLLTALYHKLVSFLVSFLRSLESDGPFFAFLTPQLARMTDMCDSPPLGVTWGVFKSKYNLFLQISNFASLKNHIFSNLGSSQNLVNFLDFKKIGTLVLFLVM